MTSREWLPQQVAFETVRRGYSQEQVNEYLDRLEYDLRILTADRDSATHRLSELTAQLQAAQSDADDLRLQLDRTAMSTPTMSGLSERMQRMIRLAEEEASEIRARANADAADRQAETDARAAELAEARRAFEAEREKARGQLAQQVEDITNEALAESERVRTEASNQAASVVAAAQAESQRLINQATDYLEQTVAHAQRLDADATAERQRLDAEAAARRQEVEEDFTIAITARRAQAHQYVADQENESRQQADELVASATAEAARIVAEADAEASRRVSLAAQESHRRVVEADEAVDHLVDLRTHVLTQLAGLRPFLEQIDEAAARADDLLQARSDEAGKPGGADFDPEVGTVDFSAGDPRDLDSPDAAPEQALPEARDGGADDDLPDADPADGVETGSTPVSSGRRA